MNKFKFYITTAIDYTNSKPHLGHAYEKIFADVIARFQRLLGSDVCFVTGTDEHGKKVEDAAKEAKKDPQEFADHLAKFFKELWEKLDISNNFFIRTTDENHIKTALEIFNKVYQKGDIYKGFYEGLYCTRCEAFYTEKELQDGKCPIHKKKVEKFKEETYFFKMGKYQKQIVEYIKTHDFILPVERKNEILNRLNEDLRDLSISRTTVKWGIPLPIDKNHTAYVWFDALLNYISAIDYPGEKFKKYWPADVHVIGKDIIWFHTVIWPAILLSAGFDLPKLVYVHGFVNIQGEKLSKSGKVIDPIKLLDKYGSDAVRYFLMREIRAGEDGDFSEKALAERLNGELADDLGNLVNRVLVLTEKNFKEIPVSEQDYIVGFALSKKDKIRELMEKFHFHLALNEIWSIVVESNKYINEKKAWELKGEKLEKVLYNLLETLRILAIYLSPFIPATSEKIFEQLGVEKRFSWDDLKFGLLKGKINRGEILFKKVEK